MTLMMWVDVEIVYYTCVIYFSWEFIMARSKSYIFPCCHVSTLNLY